MSKSNSHLPPLPPGEGRGEGARGVGVRGSQNAGAADLRTAPRDSTRTLTLALSRRERGPEHLARSAPVWIVVLFCSGLPLIWIAWQLISNPHVFVEAWPDWFRLKLLGRTILYNGSTAILATLLGVPVGIVLGRGRGIVPKVLWVALPVSLLLPSLAYAYGWSQCFRLLAHPIGEVLHALMEPDAKILRALGVSLNFLKSPVPGAPNGWYAYFVPAGAADVLRCAWSLATWLWPIPATAVGIALRRIDTKLQLQALLDGGLWRVTLRELAGVITSATLVCAVLAFQEFSVYEPTGISVVATEVRMVFETGAFSSLDNPITAPLQGGAEIVGSPDQGSRSAAAVATTLPLLVVVALLSAPVLWSGRRLSVAEDLDIGDWPAALDVGGFAKLIAVGVVTLAVIVPTASLILSLHVLRSPAEIWSEFSPQIMGSVLIAFLAGTVALGLSGWSAIAKTSLPLIAALVTFLIGGQLIAIAQIRLYNRPELGPLRGWIYNAPPVVVMAFLARFGWVALVAGRSTWSPRWRGLRDLAAVDGAGPIPTAVHIIWPLAWPLLVASGVLVMALSLTEVPATLLLSPQRPPMITPMLMTWVHMQRYDPMIEASLMLMSIVAVLGLIVVGLIAIGNGKWKMVNGKWIGPGVRRISIFLFTFSIFHLVGCDKSQPEAIWCETGTGPAQVVYPRAIAYSKADDTFFVIDRMARVQHLDRKGKCINEWRMPQWQVGKPVGVSIGPDGNVYVPDTHYQRIMVYSPKGELLRHWGSAGTGNGQFIYPTDIAFDTKGHIFVSEYGDNDRIQVFSQAGEFLYAFGKFGKGDGEFIRPQSMVIDDDTMYITDACNHRIQVFKTDGTFIRTMGQSGSGPGEYRYPYGLDEDDQGHLIVCEFGNNRVQLIDKKTGKGLRTWGVGGHDPGQLAYPWGVCVDKRDRVVAVDAGNNRLQVFEF
jgi:ABC-type Fe3+ transport system permease subunit